MKRIMILLVVTFFLVTSFVYTDAYTIDEIISSLSAFTDEELVELANAVAVEQEARSSDDAANALETNALVACNI